MYDMAKDLECLLYVRTGYNMIFQKYRKVFRNGIAYNPRGGL